VLLTPAGGPTQCCEQHSIDAITATATTEHLARAMRHQRECDGLISPRLHRSRTELGAGSVGAHDHFWVQASIGSRTVDFDPTFATAQVGQHFTDATENFATDRIPEALYHRVP
jgi:hypothetical protein